jgi:serine/threonine protein kinase
MRPERWQQIKELLYQAQQLAPEEVSAFLEHSCSSDRALRQEVETLLSSSDARSSFLEASPVSVTLMPGTRLGDYEVHKILGSGGMGEVYRARDLRLRRDVAIKVLPSFMSSDKGRLGRFEQEAQAAAALNHPNILAVFQMGTYEGAPYLVSELLDGDNLRGHVNRGPMPARKAIDYGVQIAHGLAAAHEKGIVHRDLKPENLFVTKDGRVKILDFGLAKLKQPTPGHQQSVPTAAASATEPGTVMGTVGYMSPEQVRGQEVDHRTDIFSFGAVLYEMLTGKRAFQKTTSVETMSAILNEDPQPVSQFVVNVPPGLQRTVHRCLEKSPEQRFQSASDLAFALEALSDSVASPISEERGQALHRQKQAWWSGRVLVVVFLLALIVIFSNWWRRRLSSGQKLPEIHSLAVLPLQNLSGDPAQDYFSDGITDTLITDLAQVSGVKVISRTSIMHYRKTDKTLPEIASELNVDGIVEGTVQRSGDHVLVNAQLIQGLSDKHLWARSYERSASDVFALQQEVAADIAQQVHAQVANQAQLVPPKPRTPKPEALEAYLQGSYHLQLAESGSQDQELNEAGKYFQRAIDSDPDFAAAYVGLAEAHHNLWWPSSQDFDILTAAADKAVLLDPSSSDARAMLANRKFDDWDWQGAEEESRRAISFNPNNAGAHDVLGESLDVRGRFEEGWKEHQIAQALDPNRDHLSLALYNRGRFDQAIASLQRWVKIRPNDTTTHWFLSQNYQRKGMYKEWTEEVATVVTQEGLPEIGERLRKAFAASGYLGALRQTARDLEEMQEKKQAYFPGILAQVYTGLGDNNRALYWLSEGVTHRHQAISDPVLAFVKVDPAFEPLRSDSRFKDLLGRMGLLP